jgi:death on curing protein
VTLYLSLAQVVTINAEMVRRFGGIHGVRDSSALEAAVARPQLGYYADLLEEAAGFLESLLQNHPFLDGNKRTAVAATAVFLTLNGYKLSFDDIEAYDWLMGLFEASRLTKANLESWLRQHAQKM